MRGEPPWARARIFCSADNSRDAILLAGNEDAARVGRFFPSGGFREASQGAGSRHRPSGRWHATSIRDRPDRSVVRMVSNSLLPAARVRPPANNRPKLTRRATHSGSVNCLPAWR